MSSLGSLVVSLAMDTARFAADVGKAAQQMTRLSKEAAKIGAAIGASVGTGLVAVGALVKQSIDAADATSKMAQSLGLATEEMSRLAYAAELSGLSQEQLGASLGKLSKLAGDAAAGGKTANDVFTAMGVKVTDANGKLRPTSDLLGDVADKFSQYEDGAAKTALAMEVFGKSGAQMIPFLNQGRDGLSELAEEADVLGLTLTQSAGRAAEQFNDNLTRLSKAKIGLGNLIAQALLPTLEKFTNQMFASAKETGAFQRAAETAASGVRLLLSAGAILIGVFKTVGEYIGGIGAAAVALFSGRFREAFLIASATGDDLVANIKGTAATVAGIWDTTAAKVAAAAPKTGGGMAAPLVLAAEKARTAAKAIQDEVQKLNQTYAQQLQQKTFEVETFGASDRTKEILKITDAVRQGLNPQVAAALIEQIDKLHALRAAAEAADKAESARLDVLREGISVYDATRTPAEKLANETTRLNDLLAAGAISWDTYARAVFAAQDSYDQAIAGAEQTTDAVSAFVERARQNIQDSLGDAFVSIMQGNFKNIGDAFVKMLQRMVAEALAAKLTEALFGAAKPGGTGGGGIFGNVLSSIGSFLFGGRAYGGPVSAGRAVRVGEHGPEVFMPAVAGSIIPERQLAGPPQSIVVNVQAVPGMTRQTALQQGQMIGEGVQRALTRNG